MADRLCTVDGCSAKHMAKGMCSPHYWKDFRSKNLARLKDREAEYRVKNRDKLRDRNRAFIAKNPEANRTRVKEWQRKFPEKLNAKSRAYYAKTLERQRARGAAYRDAHRESIRVKSESRRKAFPEKGAARAAKRRAARMQATPKWANEFFMEEIYDLAKRRSKATGIEWHVDHAVPLSSPKVCGLHCEANLMVIPATLNHKKSNQTWLGMAQ